jgi:hypothetical protein
VGDCEQNLEIASFKLRYRQNVFPKETGIPFLAEWKVFGYRPRCHVPLSLISYPARELAQRRKLGQEKNRPRGG